MNTSTARLAHGVDVAILTEVAAGLSRPQKQLPCKLFYDEKGAQLFEQICTLPEYYPTRTELQILRANAAAMAHWIGPHARIVEFGSGSGEKTRLLLRQLEAVAEYVPVDISGGQLRTFARDLSRAFPGLNVRPVCADYTHAFALPKSNQHVERTVVFFPGSTIGNFTPSEARDFLRNAADIAGHDGGLLIGVDLRKDSATLERAYNDGAGVTAAFNLNMLEHINRVCDADFDIAAFEHRAIYDQARGRIEMHLFSRKAQEVTLGRSLTRPLQVRFAAGEVIVTEYSYKYDIAGFQEIAAGAGFTPAMVWTDPHHRFSVQAFDVSAGKPDLLLCKRQP